jgi:hypothetical protein
VATLVWSNAREDLWGLAKRRQCPYELGTGEKSVGAKSLEKDGQGLGPMLEAPQIPNPFGSSVEGFSWGCPKGHFHGSKWVAKYP